MCIHPDDVLFYLPVTSAWLRQLVLGLILICPWEHRRAILNSWVNLYPSLEANRGRSFLARYRSAGGRAGSPLHRQHLVYYP